MNVIIGAGISGLTAARRLKSLGRRFLVLEKETQPGGLSGQYPAGGYWFDYAGHYFHFLNKEHVHALVEEVSPFRRFNRVSKTYVMDRYAPFPIQFNLSYLPSAIRRIILREIESQPIVQCDNLHDSLRLNFGETLFNIFFKPFLEKYHRIDLRELAADMDKGSIPPPDKQRIADGAGGKKFLNVGYNPVFYYPKPSLREFIRRYAEPISNNELIPGEEALKVDLRRRTVTGRSGEYHYENLISTMPLNRLLEIITPNDGFPSPQNLRHISTLVVNAVLKHRRKRFHWVYLADKTLPFYRLGFYPAHPAPACYLEKTVPAGFRADLDEIRSETLYTLKQLRCIESESELVFMDVRLIPVSYILFTRDWRRTVPPVLERLKAFGVYSIGRYGSWNYTSMSDDIAGALSCSDEIAAPPPENSQHQLSGY